MVAMNIPLFATTLVCAGHVRSFEIRLASPGWEAFERQNQQVVQQAHYNDWHHVELALRSFARAIATLKEEGWRER